MCRKISRGFRIAKLRDDEYHKTLLEFRVGIIVLICSFLLTLGTIYFMFTHFTGDTTDGIGIVWAVMFGFTLVFFGAFMIVWRIMCVMYDLGRNTVDRIQPYQVTEPIIGA